MVISKNVTKLDFLDYVLFKNMFCKMGESRSSKSGCLQMGLDSIQTQSLCLELLKPIRLNDPPPQFCVFVCVRATVNLIWQSHKQDVCTFLLLLQPRRITAVKLSGHAQSLNKSKSILNTRTRSFSERDDRNMCQGVPWDFHKTSMETRFEYILYCSFYLQAVLTEQEGGGHKTINHNSKPK